ncbi:MAG: acetolactate synthase small subunit [Peptococcaceae bacterium]|jgi:acetolactate synthase-1/3 small subunit|nr:acetolactate synthase small subunit [Peptococcaceae bacterium]
MQHTLSVLVQNHAGVLSRVSGLFSRRGYNIESLAVGTTENEAISRMTIVVEGDNYVVEQVSKQLYKLVEVLKVSDITEEKYVGREMVLVTVSVEPSHRGEVVALTEIFKGRIVDLSRKTMMLELTGNEEKINAFIDALTPYGIKEMVRTGKIALVRGDIGE